MKRDLKTHASEIAHMYFGKVMSGVRDNKGKGKAILVTAHRGP
jgi:hypothetical protein